MGRHNLSALTVGRTTKALLETPNNAHTLPPPWFTPLSQNPPPSRLNRPPLRRRPGRPSTSTRKPSKTFHPVPLKYEEDELRWEYFNDHPWELAKPRIVLEDGGRDREKWDWGVELDFALRRPGEGVKRRVGQGAQARTAGEWDALWRRVSGRPVNGEAVVQRQTYLHSHTALSQEAAYDQARKEHYRHAHAHEVETRVAREEALATGAFFGLGPLEIGMQLEDRAYADWRAWAIKETAALKQMQNAAYSGSNAELEEGQGSEEDRAEEEANVDGVEEKIPGSRRGQEALGGPSAAIHP